MKLQVEIGDRIRTVEVLPQPTGYRVVVDGRERLVDAVQVAPGEWSLIVGAGDLPRSVNAAVSSSGGNGTLDVYLDGLWIPVHVRNGRVRRGAEAASSTGALQRVASPMPGKVVRVLVSPGDEVQARQGLVIVEAMKMENEVRAVRAGRVRDVVAVEGQSVEAGATLVVVE